MKMFWLFIVSALFHLNTTAQKVSVRDFDIQIGVLPIGRHNAITDVKGVLVGHQTLVEKEFIRTGVTAILPHNGNIFKEKVPAAIFIGNGFGKLAGYTQVKELGNLETPVILTNTLSVPAAMDALISYTLAQPGNEEVRSVNALVGETNDGYLNDIRGRHVTTEHILMAINQATTGPVESGNVGAGTGTICFGYKGGIGTSSRVLPEEMGGYTVGVLVQTNFGGVLRINGHEVGKKWGRYPYRKEIEQSSDGSCMIVVATDAPLLSRNLERLAARSMIGLGNTGGISSNGSGDYVIAFSTYEKNRISKTRVQEMDELTNDEMTPLFLAVIEATEEAILNALFAARSMTGRGGHRIDSFPVQQYLTDFQE